jgi:hypothetical protein
MARDRRLRTTQFDNCWGRDDPDGRVRRRAHRGTDFNAGGGHQRPGGEPSPLAQWVGNIPAPSTAVNATDTIWQFFTSKHRKPDREAGTSDPPESND